MAPPPPSKSYLIKFDDLSDTEDEQENDRMVRKSISNATTAVSTNNYPPVQQQFDENNDVIKATIADAPTVGDRYSIVKDDEVADSNTNPEQDRIVSDDEDDDEEELSYDEIDENECIPSDYDRMSDVLKKKRKKKKGKKKKKKKKGSQTSISTLSSPTERLRTLTPKVVKKLSFGNVSVSEFERCLGQHVVPYDGGWPLGISDSVAASAESGYIGDVDSVYSRKELSPLVRIDIEDFEKKKQDKLRERWNRLKEANVTDVLELREPFETRQWDHKRKCKNPLFRMLNENERMQLLLSQSSPGVSVEENTSVTGSSSRRSRSSSFSDTTTSSPTQNKVKTRVRSLSVNETYNNSYPQVEVHAVRNELERIRNGRSAEGATGCTCRKLQVYLMPSDGGKKANNRRMKPQQVKLELRKRQLLPTEAKTREELELLLHDVVENEPCCSSDDCPCVHNGIECQADACSCWHLTHQSYDAQRKQKQEVNHDVDLNVPQIQSRCGNKFGMYVVALDAINEFRKKYVYCHAVTS